MRLRTHTSLGGFVSWEHRRNGAIIAQGIAKRDKRGLPKDHRNLITDAGLDSWGSNGEGFRAYCAIGTDSTAPSESDVALGSEVMAKVMGSNSLQTHSEDSNAQTITLVGRRSVTFTFDDNYNIKEIGFRSGSSGDLSIRTLPKDANDNPITISAQTNDTLTIHHDLSLTLSPYGTDSAATLTVKTYDRDGTLLSSDDYTGKQSLTSSQIANLFDYAAPDAVAPTIRIPYSSNSSLSPTAGAGFSTTTPISATTHVDAYAAGSYTRSASLTADADAMVQTIYGIAFEFNQNTFGTLAILFDNGVTFTKDDTHTFELNLTKTWSRATT